MGKGRQELTEVIEGGIDWIVQKCAFVLVFAGPVISFLAKNIVPILPWMGPKRSMSTAQERTGHQGEVPPYECHRDAVEVLVILNGQQNSEVHFSLVGAVLMALVCLYYASVNGVCAVGVVGNASSILV